MSVVLETQALKELLGNWPNDANVVKVDSVTDDSRNVQPGCAFVCIVGLTVDGHDFAATAEQQGAALIVAERELDVSVPCVVVPDSRQALGLLAASLAGEPSQQLIMTGLTGTNGKTTTSYLLDAILRAAGKQVGVIGTLGTSQGGQAVAAGQFTTPGAVALQKQLGAFVDSRCDHAVMEVSSHGLELGRLWGTCFDVAGFTQLSQDHLDLHGSMEAYFAAKKLLFERHLKPGACAVINIDTPHGKELVASLSETRVLRCSQNDSDAELFLKQVRCSITGIEGTLQFEGSALPLKSPLLGQFNADNILLAIGCAIAAGISADQAVAGAAQLAGVPGRLEIVPGDLPYTVVVDYAHTPDAIARALEVLRPLTAGRLVAVFGCGGDRDQAKRPQMGRAAAVNADTVVVTSDNPRSEDPQEIIEMIVPGVSAHQTPASGYDQVGYIVEPDRGAAIAQAVAGLQDGDVLLIAGKGHEDYQIIGDRRLHFDDREQAALAIAKRVAQ